MRLLNFVLHNQLQTDPDDTPTTCRRRRWTNTLRPLRLYLGARPLSQLLMSMFVVADGSWPRPLCLPPALKPTARSNGSTRRFPANGGTAWHTGPTATAPSTADHPSTAFAISLGTALRSRFLHGYPGGFTPRPGAPPPLDLPCGDSCAACRACGAGVDVTAAAGVAK